MFIVSLLVYSIFLSRTNFRMDCPEPEFAKKVGAKFVKLFQAYFVELTCVQFLLFIKYYLKNCLDCLNLLLGSPLSKCLFFPPKNLEISKATTTTTIIY